MKYKLSLRRYFKILPDAVEYKGKPYPRLVCLDPRLMKVITAQDDMDNIMDYDIQWLEERKNEMGQVLTYFVREYTVSEINGDGDKTWIVQSMLSRDGTRWDMTNETPWPYDFPPIIHWQNLPREDSQYGASDLEDIIPIQDAYNEGVRNIRRILRYHAIQRPGRVAVAHSLKRHGGLTKWSCSPATRRKSPTWKCKAI